VTRLPNPRREDMSAESQQIWDQVWKTRGAVGGPQSVLMHVPQLGSRVAELGDYLRFGGLLAAPDRELAILTAGREVEARYEWQAHEPLALKAGVRPEAIEAVRSKGPVNSLMPREQLVVEVVRALYREHHLSDSLYQRALAELGREQLVELVALAGQYGLLGYILNGFEVDLPASAGPTF
jgi:4-carboxymuconolactone decarboxylase